MISLKQRFTINFSILLSVILAVVLTMIYSIFSQYRRTEFKLRLEEKALSTAALLADLNVSKQDALEILDQNSVDKLYNNRILAFDNDLNLIYSSISGANQIPSAEDLQLLKTKGSFFFSDNKIGRFGMARKLPANKALYVFVTAEDKSGQRLLWFLGYLLLGAFITGTVSVIILARSLSGRILLPLKQIQERITNISEKRLHIRLEEKRNNDEIDKLAHAFNDMMDRIDSSYKQQKEFTDNASHELRTPVTRIIMQIQNLIKHEAHNEKTLQYLDSIMMDSNQIADTISSLLLLSRINNSNTSDFFPHCRLDEIIFEALQSVSAAYPDVRTLFNIENRSDKEIDIEIKGDTNLLKIVFINLFKNAYLYSSEKLINVTLIQEENGLKVKVVNDGEVIIPADRQNLFQAFARGRNSKNIQGTGLGLRITERILNYHHATIQYEATDQNINCFTVSFT
jgi:two-component system, OmpR family, sensor histidine kinase ArlS